MLVFPCRINALVQMGPPQNEHGSLAQGEQGEQRIQPLGLPLHALKNTGRLGLH